MTIEVIVGDEVVEIEEGPENLRLYVYQHWQAGMQIKLWEQRKAIAGAAILAMQDNGKEAYEFDNEFGKEVIVAGKRAGISRVELDKDKLSGAEFSSAEMATLILAASGFDREKIDAGLKGTDPAKWKPTTSLGRLYASCLSKGKPGNPFVVVQPATKHA
jgi:hypothetical protein